MAYLLLLAPVVAMALLVTMSSLERWQETDVNGHHVAPVLVPAPLPNGRGDTSRRASSL